MTGRKTKNARQETATRILEVFDASKMVGLKIEIHNSVIEHVDESGEVSIEIPKVNEMMAAAAMARCLMPVRLTGREIRAIRKIMGLTLAELANGLGEKTAPATVSRWESEAQAMGGFAEKVFRLFVCENLREVSPGTDYNAATLSRLRIMDLWRTNSAFEVPPVVL